VGFDGVRVDLGPRVRRRLERAHARSREGRSERGDDRRHVHREGRHGDESEGPRAALDRTLPSASDAAHTPSKLPTSMLSIASWAKRSGTRRSVERLTGQTNVEREARVKSDDGRGKSLRNGVHIANGVVWEAVSPRSIHPSIDRSRPASPRAVRRPPRPTLTPSLPPLPPLYPLRPRQAPIGQSMLEVAHKNDIELEGACEVRSVHWSPYDRVGVVNADP